MAADHTANGEGTLECRDIHGALRQGREVTPHERAHLEQCPACAVLAAGGLGDALDSAVAVPSPARMPTSLTEAIEAPPSLRDRLREQPTRVRVVAAVVGAVLVPLLVFATWQRPDMDVYPGGRLWLDVAIYAVPAIFALGVALRPLHRAALPRVVEPGLVLMGLIGMLALAALPVAHHDHPASLLGLGDDFVPRARACFVTGTLAGIPVLLWVRALLRDDGPWWAVMVSLAITAALVGALSVFLHCPLVSPVHLVAGHATILVPFVVLALLGRRRRVKARA